MQTTENISRDIKESIITKIIEKLANNIKKSFIKNDLLLQKTTLDLLQELGLADCADLLQHCAYLLIYFLISPVTPYGPLAMLYLTKITEYYNISQNFVFHKYKKEFCQLISDLIIFYYCNDFKLSDIIFKVGHFEFLNFMLSTNLIFFLR